MADVIDPVSIISRVSKVPRLHVHIDPKLARYLLVPHRRSGGFLQR
jgi:hypothetical protein